MRKPYIVVNGWVEHHGDCNRFDTKSSVYKDYSYTKDGALLMLGVFENFKEFYLLILGHPHDITQRCGPLGYNSRCWEPTLNLSLHVQLFEHPTVIL